MKLLFKVNKETPIMDKLEQIAQKYQTTVKLDEDDIGHFILITPKLQVKQNEDEKHFTITIWGAQEEDLNYFKSLFGEPLQVLTELPSPMEFAKELMALPDVQNKTLEDIIAIFEIDERRLNQYKRILTIQAKRKPENKVLQQASQLLNK